MLHRRRHVFVRQQPAVISAIRANLAEFGLVAPVGRKGVMGLLEVVADTSAQGCPRWRVSYLFSNLSGLPTGALKSDHGRGFAL